ncbi:MAG: hypothetical protein IT210_15990 [Armatimonadetes bacterium]|nr:hypothetical protein [Armatimonadota bacterium]
MTPLLAQDEAIKIADEKGRVTLGRKYAGKRFAVREEADGSARLIPVRLVPEGDAPLTVDRIEAAFAALESLTDNWDGQGSPRPLPALLSAAREVYALLRAGMLAHGLGWVEPHLGANERGQIQMEWWREDRSLTLFIRSETQVEFLKAWGNDIVSQMADGEVARIGDFLALVRWLADGKTS